MPELTDHSKLQRVLFQQFGTLRRPQHAPQAALERAAGRLRRQPLLESYERSYVRTQRLVWSEQIANFCTRFGSIEVSGGSFSSVTSRLFQSK